MIKAVASAAKVAGAVSNPVGWALTAASVLRGVANTAKRLHNKYGPKPTSGTYRVNQTEVTGKRAKLF